jgi:hypothetical protein
MFLGTEEVERNVLLMVYEWKTGVILKFCILRICLVGCVLSNYADSVHNI